MARLTHWHIVGAGSIGCLFGFYLRKAGHQVTFIQKQASLSSHISVNCKLGDHNYRSATINTTHANAINTPITHLLICVKAYHTEEAIRPLKPLLAKNACVILLQNGMGNDELLQHLLPHCDLYIGSTTEASLSLGRFSIEHTGHGNTLLGKPYKSPNTSSPHLQQELINSLSCALPIQWHNDINTVLWQKLVVSCCINPLTTLYQCNNGALTKNTEAQSFIQLLINECIAVASTQNMAHALENIKQLVDEVIDKTALNTSSMRQDFLKNQGTEIDYINGYIQQLGIANNIATPTHDIIIKKIKHLIS